MPSFQINLTPSRRAATRFINEVRRSVQKAYAEEKQKSRLTQSEIARRIGVHRSVINRELRGRRDMTIGRAAEYAYALGREPFFDLRVPEAPAGDNIIMPNISASSSSATSEVNLTTPTPRTA